MADALQKYEAPEMGGSIAAERAYFTTTSYDLKRRIEKEHEVPSPLTVEMAKELMPKAASFRKKLRALYQPYIADAFRWHRRLTTMANDAEAPVAEVEKLSKLIIGKHALQERLRAELEAKHRTELLQAESAKLDVSVPVAVEPEKVVVEGSGVGFVREGTVGEMGVFLRWLADNPTVWDLIKVEQGKLNTLLRRNPALVIPGVNVTVVARVRNLGGDNAEASNEQPD